MNLKSPESLKILLEPSCESALGTRSCPLPATRSFSFSIFLTVVPSGVPLRAPRPARVPSPDLNLLEMCLRSGLKGILSQQTNAPHPSPTSAPHTPDTLGAPRSPGIITPPRAPALGVAGACLPPTPSWDLSIFKELVRFAF